MNPETIINNNYLDYSILFYYNINNNSLRLSYQKEENKFLIKTKQKINPNK